ncbi:aspartate aminotransferase family protein [Gayadomonas joobiniege]|uniref:aspartate aminotransferase family protein n=1 Tax=Gayadomonas joobiniege TaxID=1234606 RepID=UPI00037393FD|nr:aspartate aminotransferase family protein [Gayadomonas joobiniege]
MTIFDQRESDIRAYCRLYPVVFKSAENARQTDADGQEYIDFFVGAGVLNYGHNNPQMKQAIIQYLQDNGVIHSLDLHTTAKQSFLEDFTKIILEPRNMPHKIQFMGPTGTNAVEAALKLARRVTGRQQIVAFGHGFHGMTLGALACTANSYFRGAAGVPLEHVKHLKFGDSENLADDIAALEQLKKIYQDSSSGVTPPAAFLVETIQAEGGVNVAHPQWLEALDKLAKEFGSLLIVDDIQVGCGRTGSFFSFDEMDIDPDIICLAKGIGGYGTPMAMNLVKPEHDKHWSPGEHTGTFRGQNLSFVAGREALTYYQNDTLMQQVKTYGSQIKTAAEKLCAAHPTFALRGTGMIYGIDVGDGETAKQIVVESFNNGLLVSACGTGGRVVKLIPPLTIEQADLDEGLQILSEAVSTVMGVGA